MGSERQTGQSQDSELTTFYARTELKDCGLASCCGWVDFMNKRGVFEVWMHHGWQVQDNEVVAITFDPVTRVVRRVANAIRPDERVLMDPTSEHYTEAPIGVRGYWKKPAGVR